MRGISVGDVMTRNLVTCSQEETLYDCVKKMAKERVNSILITKKKRLIGIITSRDIFWTMAKNPKFNLKSTRGIDIATKKLAVIKPSADISQALEKMRNSNFRRLPVISNGELIGVLTIKDILAVQPDLYNETRSIMDEIREENQKIQQTNNYPIEGLCENCGALSELLRIEGTLLCPDCQDELS